MFVLLVVFQEVIVGELQGREQVMLYFPLLREWSG
jgi:hypothetical protein